jgi:CheY-like chemotaxis protein
MKRRVFVLDDNPARHVVFKRNNAQNDLTLVDTYDKAVRALSEGKRFDIWFLDHDLNDHEARSVRAGMYGDVHLTGEDLVSFIRTSLDRSRLPDLAVIHSVNELGAHRMAQGLIGLGIRVIRIPFSEDSGIVP